MKTVAEYLAPSTNKKWYEEYPKTQKACTHSKTDLTVINLKDDAKRFLEAETTAYQLKQSKSKNSDYDWLKTALSKGTSSDKIAASVVLLQDSPKHNLGRLTTLVSQVKAAKQNQCPTLITALRDLFLSDLLHPSFKLVKFDDQDLDKLDKLSIPTKAEKGVPFMSRNKLLAHWYFEDQLKEIYEKFIVSLSQIASNTVDSNREKTVTVMNDLLMGNSEQEHKLLDFLVNKIGDPSNKVASKVLFCLNKLLFEHSNMKVVVLREIEKLLFRNNVSPRAQYYAICLLTQFVLDRDDAETANNLIDVYFSFFKACLKKGEPDSRMMAAILTGVNRAYRFSKVDSQQLNDHIDSLYKVVHIGSFNVSLNALSLLFQVVKKNEQQTNRYYSAFYKKLLDPQIGVGNKRAIFLNLLYRVLLNDVSVIRLKAFLKRIFQVISTYPANMACATLYVVSQVLKSKKNTHQIMSFETEIKVEKEEESTVKSDSESESSEDENEKPEEESNIVISNTIVGNSKVVSKIEEIETKEEITIKDELDPEKEYNPFCRNPLGSGANNSFFHELYRMADHFHPSVALFASNIRKGQPIDYSGDPLEDLNLIRFLDRFAFKNPKKLESKKVSRQGDPLARRAGYVPQGLRSVPVGSEAYLTQQEDKIPVDELFLYQFLNKRKDQRVKSEDKDDDNESVTSEDFNAMLDGLSGDLDFAGDASAKKRKKKDDSDEEESENDESDMNEEDLGEMEDSGDDIDEEQEDADNDLEDGEMDDLSDDMEGYSDIDFDDEGSDIDFDDEDGDDDVLREELASMKKSGGKKGKKSEENVFMSAEKFAEMMEEQGISESKHGGSNSMSRADGASDKQLKWESKRNQRFSGSRFGKKGNKRTTSFKNNKKNSKRQKR